MKCTMIYYFSEKMKIGKVKKLVANLYDKKRNIVHMHILKTMENVRKHRDINLLKLKQELFGVRTELSCSNIFLGKFISK